MERISTFATIILPIHNYGVSFIYSETEALLLGLFYFIVVMLF